MYINSPGGVVTAGLAIYDTMQVTPTQQFNGNDPPCFDMVNKSWCSDPADGTLDH